MFSAKSSLMLSLSCAVFAAVVFSDAALAEHAIPKVLVKAVFVKKTTIPKVVRSLGSLSAMNQAALSSNTDGRIVQILYQDGQFVSSGLPVVQLDARQVKSAYQQSVTDYRLSQVKYKNAKALEDEAVSAQQIAVLKAGMDNKFAIMQSMQVSLNQLTITAPITGTLGAFKVNKGDFVKAGAPLVLLTDVKHLQVQYQIPETALPELRLGQLVSIESDLYKNKPFYGTVSYISPTVDSVTRSVTLQATLDNLDKKLRPGVFVSIAQKVGALKNALVVPESAVMADIQGYYVYKVEKEIALKTYIKEVQRYETMIVVASGLKQGDQLVTAGQQKLHDGSAVRVMTPQAKGAGKHEAA